MSQREVLVRRIDACARLVGACKVKKTSEGEGVLEGEILCHLGKRERKTIKSICREGKNGEKTTIG